MSKIIHKSNVVELIENMIQNECETAEMYTAVDPKNKSRREMIKAIRIGVLTQLLYELDNI